MYESQYQGKIEETKQEEKAHFPGYFERIFLAIIRASSTLGSVNSSQSRSAYGAYASARLTAQSTPPVVW